MSDRKTLVPEMLPAPESPVGSADSVRARVVRHVRTVVTAGAAVAMCAADEPANPGYFVVDMMPAPAGPKNCSPDMPNVNLDARARLVRKKGSLVWLEVSLYYSAPAPYSPKSVEVKGIQLARMGLAVGAELVDNDWPNSKVWLRPKAGPGPITFTTQCLCRGKPLHGNTLVEIVITPKPGASWKDQPTEKELQEMNAGLTVEVHPPGF